MTSIVRTETFLVARLPLPPSANHLYKNIPWTLPDGRLTSRRVATSEYLAFQHEALSCLQKAQMSVESIEYIHECKKHRQFLPLKLEIIYYVEHLWIGDLDNRIKALQDVLFKRFLHLNDTLVTHLDVRKRKSQDSPHCTIRLSITRLDEEDEQWLV